MTEILTESFCERCGTRYTFESAAPRRSRIGRVRTLSKGMKNFVLSDDASFSEAMAEARSEEELAVVSHQLDAFHQTFNFCLTCRQYTCGDCWNTAEGRCLTCAPIPGIEESVYAATPPVAMFQEPVEAYDATPDTGSWPDADLSAARLSRALGLDEAEAEATLEAVGLNDGTFDLAAAEAAAAAVAAPDDATASAQPVPVVDEHAAVVDEHAAVVDDAGRAVAGIAPGQSLEDAVAEYEARIAAEEAEEAEVADVARAAAALAAAAAIDPPIGQIEVEDRAPIELPQRITESEAISRAAPEPEAEPTAAQEDGAVASEESELAPVASLAAVDNGATLVAPEPEEALAAGELVSAPAPERAAAGADKLLGAPDLEPEPAATDELPGTAETEPEPELAAPPVAAAAAAAPDLAGAPRDDVVPQPSWPEPAPASGPDVTAPSPAAPAPAANPWLTVAPDESGEPQWPVAPAFPVPATRREMPMTLAGRPLIPQVDPADMWAASAREVLTGTPQAAMPAAAPAPTAQPCVSCGLSLSANARFCRRCGTRQA